MVHYGLNKIKLAYDAQYKIVILTSLIYWLSGLGLGLEGHLPGLGLGLSLENAGLEPILDL